MDRPPKEMHSTRKEIISTSGVIISQSYAKYLPYFLIQKILVPISNESTKAW
jgi:hypothetical protein